MNVFRKDLEGRFTFANSLFAQTLGRPVEEILGKTDFDLFEGKLAAKYRQDDLRVIATRETFEDVEQHIVGGDTHYVEVLKTPVYDARGNVVETQGIFWDITARKRAEQALQVSEERYELAVRGSKDGLWDWNVLTGAVYFSPRMKQLLGYRDDEMENVFASFESRRTTHGWRRLTAVAAAAVIFVGTAVAVARIIDHDSSVTASRTVALRAPGGPTVVVAKIGANGDGAIGTSDLPVPPAGRVYQLWAQTTATTPMHSAGVLGRSPGGRHIRVPTSSVRIAISVEPDGGSRAPTTKPVAISDLGAL